MAPIASAEVRNKLAQRYQQSYAGANALARLGTMVKFASAAIGGTMAVAGLLTATDAGSGVLLLTATLVAAFAIAGGGWVSGMIIRTQGQIIHSLLDTAVNTSPLLDNSTRTQFLGSADAQPGLIVRHGSEF